MNEAESQEPLVWTVGEGPQKIITSTEYDLREATQLYNGGLIEKTIQKCLEKTSAGSLVQPDEAEFASATREAHRKGEKSYHVKAFRGSKDGNDYQNSERNPVLLLTKSRLSILSRYWHILWFQKATCVLPV